MRENTELAQSEHLDQEMRLDILTFRDSESIELLVTVWFGRRNGESNCKTYYATTATDIIPNVMLILFRSHVM